MKRALSISAAILFAAVYPFACISTCYDSKFDGVLFNYFYNYDGVFLFLRYLVIFALLFFITFLNKRNHHFLRIYIPVVMAILTACILLDRFHTHHLMYNYYLCLWQCAAIAVANISVFLSATLFCQEGYAAFYRNFWWAILGVYLFVLYIAFLRTPDAYQLTVNMQPSNGTLKYFKYIINHPSDGYVVLICIGNLLIFTPLPFFLRNAFRKTPFWVFLIIGILMPIAVEAYQYIFRCGNVDIDDLLLNWSGFAVGLLLEEWIYRLKIKPSKKPLN